ncbi:hypothetical protein CTZ24_25565 (plasmid) [Pantoea phytobeneficialis]|uniref:Uncharacterized protein n=1 Tax=Pantoea phytobeneficialis TaxID=2052056 RepID=A0AAP9KSH2_9GAMM|nr:hypothetical protein CTZ24_25565 [Pantoea phytobeneficialis]
MILCKVPEQKNEAPTLIGEVLVSASSHQEDNDTDNGANCLQGDQHIFLSAAVLSLGRRLVQSVGGIHYF